MKAGRLLVLATVFFASSALYSQSEPNLANGYTPFGSYQGGGLDSVNLMNGNLLVRVPFPEHYVERGKGLDNDFALMMNAKLWTVGFIPGTAGNFGWIQNPNWSGPTSTASLYPTFFRTYEIDTAGPGQNATTYSDYGYGIITPDGRTLGGPDIDISPDSGWVLIKTNPDGNGTPQSGIGIDGAGNQYPIVHWQGGCTTTSENNLQGAATTTICNQTATPATVTDPNGNIYTFFNGSPYDRDTLGRNVPAFGTSASTSTSDYSGCVSPLPISSARLASYPALNNTTNQIKVCNSKFSLQTAFNISGTPEGLANEELPVTWIYPDGSKWAFQYDNYGNLTFVSLPLGGTISYQWTTVPFPFISPGTQVPASRAITRRTVTDNNGHSSMWTYQWMTAQSNPYSLGGTYTNLMTDALGNDSVHVFGNYGPTAGFFETTSFYYQGSSSSGQLLRRVDTTYLSGATNPWPTSIQTTVYPSGKVSLVTNTYDSSGFARVVTQKAYDWGQGAPGPLLRETDTSYQWQVNSAYLNAHLITLPASVVVKDGGGCALAETDYTYDESAYLRSYQNTVGPLPAGTFGAAPNPAPVRGNLTTVARWLAPATSCNPKGGTAVITHTYWYDTGEVYQQIDARGNATTHSYDQVYAGAYSTETCLPSANGVAHCSSGTYDVTTGLLTSLTDENAAYQASGNTQGDPAHTSNYTYDFLSRLTLAQSPPDPNNGNARAQTSVAYSPSNTFPFTVTKTRSITPTTSDSVSSFYDGLGRVFKTQHPLPNGTAEVDTTYDALGRVASVTNPYFSTSDPTYGITQTAYDALGRATQVTDQDGSIKTASYSQGGCGTGDDTTAVDEAGKIRRTCADGLGRLIEVDEPQASGGSSLVNGYTTVYGYDGLSNLLRVDQKGSAPSDSTQWRTRLFTYDTLGRLLTAQNPESGTITYTYDADSNVATKTDARGIQTTYAYDELNRVTSKTFSDGTPTASYGYDAGCCGVNPQNGVGHMTYASAGDTEMVYVFDVMGRITTQADCPPSGLARGYCYVLTAAHDLAGDVTSLGYPDWTTITYTPDSAGRMVSAVDSAHGINYVTSATYAPDSALTGFVSGNSGSFAGITNSFSYNQRLQPVNMSAFIGGQQTDLPANTVFSIGYDFHLGNGDNGNVFGITNYRDSTRSQSFTYDSLNRLISAQNAGTDCTKKTVNSNQTEYWGNSYSYDAWGNLLAKSVSKCKAENLSVTAQTNNRLFGYGYDAAGNMTSDPTDGVTSTFDAESRIITASKNGTTSYTYNSLANRVRKDVSGGNSTEYFYFGGEIVAELNPATGAFTNYIYFDGDRVARRDGTTGPVSYYFSDHLKTASVVTDASGNIKEDEDYYPWGGELPLVNNDSNHYKFTGKERDSETGLDDFGARYYSNGLGRFVSADWADSPEPVPYAVFGDPQSLNLYTYVRNLPTTSFDVDGHQIISEGVKTEELTAPQRPVPCPGLATCLQDTFPPLPKPAAAAISVAVAPMCFATCVPGIPSTSSVVDDLWGDIFGPDVASFIQKVNDTLAHPCGHDPNVSCGIAAPVEEGEFSISDWRGYPTNLPKPTGPFRILEGEEYATARAAANNTNKTLHRLNPSLNGQQIHEIQPVKFNGSPTSLSNKAFVSPSVHIALTVFWNELLRVLMR